jgi:hypothetical protein
MNRNLLKKGNNYVSTQKPKKIYQPNLKDNLKNIFNFNIDNKIIENEESFKVQGKNYSQ